MYANPKTACGIVHIAINNRNVPLSEGLADALVSAATTPDTKLPNPQSNSKNPAALSNQNPMMAMGKGSRNKKNSNPMDAQKSKLLSVNDLRAPVMK